MRKFWVLVLTPNVYYVSHTDARGRLSIQQSTDLMRAFKFTSLVAAQNQTRLLYGITPLDSILEIEPQIVQKYVISTKTNDENINEA